MYIILINILLTTTFPGALISSLPMTHRLGVCDDS